MEYAFTNSYKAIERMYYKRVQDFNNTVLVDDVDAAVRECGRYVAVPRNKKYTKDTVLDLIEKAQAVVKEKAMEEWTSKCGYVREVSTIKPSGTIKITMDKTKLGTVRYYKVEASSYTDYGISLSRVLNNIKSVRSLLMYSLDCDGKLPDNVLYEDTIPKFRHEITLDEALDVFVCLGFTVTNISDTTIILVNDDIIAL